MNLSNIKKEYNAVFSLRQNCWPAWALYQFELSPFFGVIDFMLSHSLEKVNLLLQNRFDRFLHFENLSFISFWDDDAKLRLRDNLYEIDSCHDFKTDVNTPTSWPSYSGIKLNYEHRINRFLTTIEMEKSILFIRTGGTYEEARSLEQISSQIVKHNFSVLLLIPADVTTVTQEDWGLQNIRVIKCPIMDVYQYNEGFWNDLFDGISIRPHA
ncbi:amino acid permease [Bacillus cereus]|nr:amino acid permease [Bacillus cereus]